MCSLNKDLNGPTHGVHLKEDLTPLTENQQKVLQYYTKNPNATRNGAAKDLFLNPKTVKHSVHVLRKAGLLRELEVPEDIQERVWRLSKNGNTPTDIAKKLNIRKDQVQEYLNEEHEKPKQKAKNSVSQARKRNKRAFTPTPRKEFSLEAHGDDWQKKIRSSSSRHTDSSVNEGMQALSFTREETRRRDQLLEELNEIDTQAAERAAEYSHSTGRAAEPSHSTGRVIEELPETGDTQEQPVTVVSSQQCWDEYGRPYTIFFMSDGPPQYQWDKLSGK
jgi:hypothetical protein